MLAVAGESAGDFSAINAVTALYRIARALTSRAGRVRRKEAAFITADARFAEARPPSRLVEAFSHWSPYDRVRDVNADP